MANRYWVGGTGTWDTTTTTNWSASSGGAGGASVPTITDDVFFDAGSGTVVVSVPASTTVVCNNLTITKASSTFNTTTSSIIAVNGSFEQPSVITWNPTSTSRLRFTSTSTGNTVKTNGGTLAIGVDFYGSGTTGGTWTLSDALTLGNTSANGALVVTAGTFDTGGFAVSCFTFTSSNTNTRTINLNGSTLTVTGATFSFATSTGLTFNAGSSQINFTYTAGATTFTTGNQIFNNASLTAVVSSDFNIVGSSPTFNNLSIVGFTSSTSVKNIDFDSGAVITVTGTFTVAAGTNATTRNEVGAVTAGTPVTINAAAVSLTDCDFQDVIAGGAAAPWTGTRLGNLQGNTNITFTSKTVYWNLGGSQNWTSTAWATSSGGTPAVNNYPLAQDTAIFDNSGAVGTVAFLSSGSGIGTIDASARTTPMTLAFSSATPKVYGDIKLSTAVTSTGTSGGGPGLYSRSVQTITSNGASFPVTLAVGGTPNAASGSTSGVRFADAFNGGSITHSSGTIDLNSQTVTLSGSVTSGTTSVRTTTYGASGKYVLTGSGTVFSYVSATNYTAATGNNVVEMTYAGATATGIGCPGILGNTISFYVKAGTYAFTLSAASSVKNLDFTGFSGSVSLPFNLTVTAGYILLNSGITSFSGSGNLSFGGGGTTTVTTAGVLLDCPVSFGATTTSLIDNMTVGTTRTCSLASTNGVLQLNNNTLSTGVFSSNVSVARTIAFGTGNITCTGTGTVWNMGTVTGFTYTGTPTVNISNAGSTAITVTPGPVTETQALNFNITAGTYTLTLSSGNVQNLNFTGFSGTISASGTVVYGNVTIPATATATAFVSTFSKTTGSQTLTTNGKTIGSTTISAGSTLQPQDALTLGTTSTLTVTGTLDANSKTITAGLYSIPATAVIQNNTGVFTASGTGAVWTLTAGASIQNTPSVTLSDTSATARTFAGGGATYGTLTIGGTTGSSNTTISGSNTFSTFTSTKTVAHTITFTSATTQTISTWSVNGSAGNLVTLAPSTAATAYSLYFSGRTSASYLSVSYCTAIVGEFYVGATSTNGGGNTNVYFTAAPAATTYYWVGGTGNWDSATTTNWATSSGGAGGAGFPTSTDDVVFDVNSNVGTGAFTVTLTGTPRCKSLTFGTGAQALDGTMTLAGSVAWQVYGSLTFPATNLTRSYTGTLTLASTTTGNTVTTNGVSLTTSSITFGQGALGTGGYWTLGSALTTTSGIISVVSGTFDTSSVSNYSITSTATLTSTGTVSRTIKLNSSAVALLSTPVSFTTTGLTFNAGTSTITCSSTNQTFSGAGLTFYDVVFSAVGTRAVAMTGANTFNNLTLTASPASATASLNRYITLAADIVVLGTFACNAVTGNATIRMGVRSSTYGTPRTITAAAVALYDVDFQDIVGAGAASWTGTRLGDAQGNTNITFPAAKTVYWNLAGAQNWSATGWATSSGGTPAQNNFPLAQDTAVFDNTGSVTGTITINVDWYIGTLNTNNRTSAMTLDSSSLIPSFFGNVILGTGVTMTGTAAWSAVNRVSTQTLTSNGRTFTPPLTINSLTGTFVLQDAATFGATLTFTSGNFNSNTYALSAVSNINGSNAATKTITISSTWSVGTIWTFTAATATTFTGGGTVSMISSTPKSFNGGSNNYSTITLNQGGAGTLTISGNNSFANITNTYSATGATTISFPGIGTQTVSSFTASGAAAKLLTLNSSAAGTQSTIAVSGSNTISIDYLNVKDIAFTPGPATDGTTPYVHYVGANSTNSGNNAGALFQAGGTGAITVYQISNAATTTWTVPSGWNNTNTIHLIGAGGGGGTAAGATPNTAAGGGGGGGGYTRITNFSTSSGTSVSITVGAGGTAGLSGGTTSWNAGAFTAGGGGGGSATSAPSSTGGTGGVGSTFNGGAGGAGGTSTTLNSGAGAGGGGGAGGPNGNGAAGGNGFATTTAASIAGGGGGGNGGGSAGGNASAAVGGTGGNNSAGAGGGASAVAGFSGGGSGGNVSSAGGVFSSNGIDILNTVGGGGGTGGAGSATTVGSATAFGSGGSGGGQSTAYFNRTGGAGAQGLIVIAYTPTGGTTYTGTVAETSTATDLFSGALLFSGVVSEAATATDSITTLANFYSAISESATGTDAILGSLIFSGVVDESATATDQYLAGLSFSSAFADAIIATDDISTALVMPVSFADSATATDAILGLNTLYTVVAESGTATDTPTAVMQARASLNEAASASELISTRAVFGITYNEATTAADTLVPAVTYTVQLAELATASDQFLGAYLWNQIDDSQTPGWVPVVNTQPQSWTEIDDNQDPNWQNIPTM